jgi:hypothetical protein
MGSRSTFSARTEDTMGRNSGFAWKLCGVTGSEVVVPIASWGVGGSVERSERRDLEGSIGSLWTNWEG